jgi:methyl-accepting chemotaxis protein
MFLKGGILTTSRNRRQLRNFLVRPSFQLRLAVTHVAFVFVVVAFLFIGQVSLIYYDLPRSADIWAQYALARLMVLVLGRMGVVVLLIVAVSFIYHVIFSHRLCGPLINMTHTFERISKGDLTRKVLLRQKDFLKDEAYTINGMMTALNARILTIKENQTMLMSLATDLPQGPLEDKIKVVIERNQVLLDEWKVEPEPLQSRQNG